MQTSIHDLEITKDSISHALTYASKCAVQKIYETYHCLLDSDMEVSDDDTEAVYKAVKTLYIIQQIMTDKIPK